MAIIHPKEKRFCGQRIIAWMLAYVVLFFANQFDSHWSHR
ncbi:hypothetical protein HMPREF1248_0012 [Coriobacteriaceae bacterium BV3Ac1]|nr:hypothetical protein HMPREF1248_0012 [Coriobacteriaceae bacterium BV3Ac1]